MKYAIWLLAIAGCLDSSMRYPVDAVAELRPLGAAVSGPLELLGANSERPPEEPDDGFPDPFEGTEYRTFAAYRVALPDATPRRVRIFDATSCDGPRDALPQVADLESIHRRGGETHFLIGGIDADTIVALVSLEAESYGSISGRIAVVHAPDNPDGTPGEWHACGAFPVF